jgi:hypothetical protein
MDARFERKPCAALLLVLGCGACATVTRAPIEVSDDDVTWTGVSGSLRMSADQPSDEGKTTVHMDFEIDRADAESMGQVGVGEFVQLNSLAINGPRNYTLLTDVTQGSVMVRFSHLAQMVRFDGSVGMAFVETDMELRTLLQTDQDTDFGIGPKVGVRFSF